ncbi:hypothetical protein [Deinococcus xianganensis]|uniref:Uncharacterized protein n=1 Tax=Deinococcus xianganensis TaxID=1507289 RepID=A0A6I4YLJ8_9DEIO|nr:hypothetical protein [Deinococcus xianganensis]MXV20786.1 hypothetical protein [Deinococcus xianganensis]
MTHAQRITTTPNLPLPDMYPRGTAEAGPVCDGCQVEHVTRPGYCSRCRPLTKSRRGTLRGAAGLLLVMAGSGADHLALAALIILTGLLLLLWGAARLDGHRTADLFRALHAVLRTALRAQPGGRAQ